MDKIIEISEIYILQTAFQVKSKKLAQPPPSPKKKKKKLNNIYIDKSEKFVYVIKQSEHILEKWYGRESYFIWLWHSCKVSLMPKTIHL